MNTKKESIRKLEAPSVFINSNILLEDTIVTNNFSSEIRDKTIVESNDKLENIDLTSNYVETVISQDSIIIPELDTEPFEDPNTFKLVSNTNNATYAKDYELEGYDEGNWVIKQLLAMGACPFYDGISSNDLQIRLINLLKLGIKHIFCLQKEYGVSMPKYYDIFIRDIYPNRVNLGLGEDLILPTFTHLPIPDCGIIDDLVIEKEIDKCIYYLKKGQPCFVHCWGGHGRAGTFCGIVLAKLYKLSGELILKYLQTVHDCRYTLCLCPCPQKKNQIDQILRFIN